MAVSNAISEVAIEAKTALMDIVGAQEVQAMVQNNTGLAAAIQGLGSNVIAGLAATQGNLLANDMQKGPTHGTDIQIG